jgi:hypothetical protein
MRQALQDVWDINFEEARKSTEEISQRGTAICHFRVPEPGLLITREHIANALDRRRFGLISERDLVIWATVLLLNDAYVWDPGDEDLIAEWLNDISLNLDAS